MDRRSAPVFVVGYPEQRPPEVYRGCTGALGRPSLPERGRRAWRGGEREKNVLAAMLQMRVWARQQPGM